MSEPLITDELKTAVRRGAQEHARRFVSPRSRANIDFLLDALDHEPGGIQPKVRIALRLLVEHVSALERRVDELEAQR